MLISHAFLFDCHVQFYFLIRTAFFVFFRSNGRHVIYHDKVNAWLLTFSLKYYFFAFKVNYFSSKAFVATRAMSAPDSWDLMVTDDEEAVDDETSSAAGVHTAGNRGIRRGTRRGHDKRVPSDARRRILDTYKAGGDRKMAAVANGVAVKTAYDYIHRGDGDAPPKKRGGQTTKKVADEMVEKMVEYLEVNPQISLKEITNKIRQETGVRISTNTAHKHLHGKFYTVKKVLPQPVNMNSAENKKKRAEFVKKVMDANGEGKTVLYIDETNCNLFVRRSQGRSRRGLVKVATSKGANVHVIGAISQTGLVYWERRRGSFRKEECREWLRRALRQCPQPMDRIVVVCDNAPVHNDIESVAAEPEFEGVEILRMAPYSAPLNPIEECWSAFKAAMKRSMAVTFDDMMSTRDGLSQTEHRLRYLEEHIDRSIAAVTPMCCLNCFNHVQKHYAACMTLANLAMGV